MSARHVRQLLEARLHREGGGADARELLHALLDGADLAGIDGGAAVLTLRMPRRLLDALCEWEADADDDGVDEGASW